MEKVKVLR